MLPDCQVPAEDPALRTENDLTSSEASLLRSVQTAHLDFASTGKHRSWNKKKKRLFTFVSLENWISKKRASYTTIMCANQAKGLQPTRLKSRFYISLKMKLIIRFHLGATFHSVLYVITDSGFNSVFMLLNSISNFIFRHYQYLLVTSRNVRTSWCRCVQP